ncbi:hypothetical protein MCEMSEM29_01125 [Methylophilaceae bacterium]
MKIRVYYPNFFFDTAIIGAAYQIFKGMHSPSNGVSLMGIASIPAFNDSFYINSIPIWAKSIVYKVLSYQSILNISEAKKTFGWGPKYCNKQRFNESYQSLS